MKNYSSWGKSFGASWGNSWGTIRITAGGIQVWMGSWVLKPAKVWDGSKWKTARVNIWSGTTWKSLQK